MSTIGDAYDEIIAQVAATLDSGYKRLPDPLTLEENNEQFLKRGYGAVIGPMENPQRELCNRLYIRRTISVILTNRITARDFDSVKRSDSQAAMIADMDNVMLALHQLGLNTANVVNALTVLDDSGVTEIFVDKDNYISCSATVLVEYKKGS